MSEREEQFFSRAEKALITLEKTKAWYKSAAMAFAVSFIVCVSAAGALGYKFGLMQKELQGKASIDSVRLLKQSSEALSDALLGLIDDRDHKVVAKEFIEKYKIMNDNIFVFTTERSVVTFNEGEQK